MNLSRDRMLEDFEIIKFVITKYEITGELESEWGDKDTLYQQCSELRSKIKKILDKEFTQSQLIH